LRIAVPRSQYPVGVELLLLVIGRITGKLEITVRILPIAGWKVFPGRPIRPLVR
jgi:hypothetical protein